MTHAAALFIVKHDLHHKVRWPQTLLRRQLLQPIRGCLSCHLGCEMCPGHLSAAYGEHADWVDQRHHSAFPTWLEIGSTIKEHLHNLRQVFDRLQEAGIHLKSTNSHPLGDGRGCVP